MRDTVFSPAFGNRPSQLVGRESLIQRVLAGLGEMPGSRERAVLLLGQRGTGKTVLLWELTDRARELGYVVAAPTVVDDDMLERIVEKIQDDGERYIKDRKTSVSGGSVGAFGFSVGLEFTKEVQESKSPQYKLLQLCRCLSDQGHGVLLLIDEVQANVAALRQLVIAYQELVGQQLDVAIVMAGLPAAVSATLNDPALTFLNRARKISLDPLKTSEVDAFFSQAFDTLGITVPPTIRRKAAEAVQGSPYMLQLVGHNLVLYARDGEPVDDALLADVLAASREDFENDVCRTTLAALSGRDVDFLQAMSQDEGASRMADIAERMAVTSDYAQKYRRRLIDAGVIEVPHRGEVAFAVPYLADYLRKDD